MFGAAYMRSGYNGPELLHLVITFRDYISFKEQLAGSNSTEQLLSVGELANRDKVLNKTR